MTPDEVLAIFREELLSKFITPGILFVVCVFGAAITSRGLKRKQIVAISLGLIFTATSIYAGVIYTAMPLWIFALMVACGLLPGLKPEATRVRL